MAVLNLKCIIIIYFKDLSCQSGPESSFLFTTIFVTEDIDHVETLELNVTRMDAPILTECINSLKQFRTLKRHKDQLEVITENRKTSVKFSAEKQCSSVSVLGLPGTFCSLLDWSSQLYCSAIAFILVQGPTKSSCVHRSLSPTLKKVTCTTSLWIGVILRRQRILTSILLAHDIKVPHV
ncbi:hypothetical protein ILYODFUR_029588 [Ilyodon furcidens]|uniref:Uncharacterized protein n=1 Tax=Ilyodon furcidens TaxID=33524 RepID=A0ABV0TQP9_9TELE